MTESNVATSAKQSPYLTGFVVMVDGKTLTSAANQFANTADTTLLNKQGVVISCR